MVKPKGFSSVLLVLLIFLVIIFTSYFFLINKKNPDVSPTRNIEAVIQTASTDMYSFGGLEFPVSMRPTMLGSQSSDASKGIVTYTSSDKSLTFSYPNTWEVCTDATNSTIELEPLALDTRGNKLCDLVKPYAGLYVKVDTENTKTKDELKALLQSAIDEDLEYRNNFISSRPDVEVNNLVEEITINGLEGFLVYEFGVHGPTLKSYYLMSESGTKLLSVKAALDYGDEGVLAVQDYILKNLAF